MRARTESGLPGSVSCETLERLSELVALVQRWNPTIRLVSDTGSAELWSRHVADSMRLAPFVPDLVEAADLGSGGGFPGLVLSIALGTTFTLIESDRRKGAFLREAIRATGARATVWTERVEKLAGRQFDLITARAFAPLPRLVQASRHLLGPRGRYLLLVGNQAMPDSPEIEDEFDVVRHAASSEGAVLELTRTRRAERG